VLSLAERVAPGVLGREGVPFPPPLVKLLSFELPFLTPCFPPPGCLPTPPHSPRVNQGIGPPFPGSMFKGVAVMFPDPFCCCGPSHTSNCFNARGPPRLAPLHPIAPLPPPPSRLFFPRPPPDGLREVFLSPVAAQLGTVVRRSPWFPPPLLRHPRFSEFLPPPLRYTEFDGFLLRLLQGGPGVKLGWLMTLPAATSLLLCRVRLFLRLYGGPSIPTLTRALGAPSSGVPTKSARRGVSPVVAGFVYVPDHTIFPCSTHEGSGIRTHL